MEIKEWLKDQITTHLSQELFIVDIIIKGSSNSPKITVLLDGDRGVTIDQCAEISRAVEPALDEHPEIGENYNLEISSAGTEIRLNRQFYKNIGRKLQVFTQENQEIKGTLKDIDGEKIILEKSGKKNAGSSVEIPLEQIKKTNVIVSI